MATAKRWQPRSTKDRDTNVSTKWLAQANEKSACYIAAARLYRELRDEASALRCEKAARKLYGKRS